MQRKKKIGCHRHIKNIDIFGYPVHLSFDGKTGGAAGVFMAQPTHQTCLGGLLTFTFVAVIILALINVDQQTEEDRWTLKQSYEFVLPGGLSNQSDSKMSWLNLQDEEIAISLSISEATTTRQLGAQDYEEIMKYLQIDFI